MLTIPALIVGPATGFFYGEMKGRAWSGIGIRTLALGGMMSAFAICGWNCNTNDKSKVAASQAVFFVSAGAFLGSAIYDMAIVKTAVQKHNQRSHQKQIAVYPWYFSGLESIGVVLSYRF